MKQLLIDTQPFSPSNNNIILSESTKTSNGNVIISGLLATAEVENGNGRFYSKNLWEREINKYNTLIKENRATGELDHNSKEIIEFKNVSHIIREIWWDKNNIMGKVEILPTPSGNILRVLLENNVLVGISSRGLGSLEKRKNGLMEVQDDFELVCWDFVSTPSNPGSWMKLKNNLNESLNRGYYNQYQNINNIIREILILNS